MGKTSEAQKRAAKAWKEKNRDKVRRQSYKDSAKLFIRTHSTEEELQEIESLIAERRKTLAEEAK